MNTAAIKPADSSYKGMMRAASRITPKPGNGAMTDSQKENPSKLTVARTTAMDTSRNHPQNSRAFRSTPVRGIHANTVATRTNAIVRTLSNAPKILLTPVDVQDRGD